MDVFIIQIGEDAMAKLNTKIVMLEGEHGKDGTNIKSVEKSASDGLTDTYTITLTDGSKSSFNVTNGKGISSIEKASANTYTINYNDGTTLTLTLDVDTELSTTSTNPVQNKAIAEGINSIQTQIVPTASIESGETASKAYNVGDFLVKDGILYKVTKAIAEGDVLTVGTNIDMTTVGSELSSARSNSFVIKEVLHVASTTATATDYTTEPLDNYNFFIVSCSVLGFRPGTLYKGSPTSFYSKAELLDTANYSGGTQIIVYETDGAAGSRITRLKYVNNTSVKLWHAGPYPFEVRIYGIKA